MPLMSSVSVPNGAPLTVIVTVPDGGAPSSGGGEETTISASRSCPATALVDANRTRVVVAARPTVRFADPSLVRKLPKGS